MFLLTFSFFLLLLECKHPDECGRPDFFLTAKLVKLKLGTTENNFPDTRIVPLFQKLSVTHLDRPNVYFRPGQNWFELIVIKALLAGHAQFTYQFADLHINGTLVILIIMLTLFLHERTPLTQKPLISYSVDMLVVCSLLLEYSQHESTFSINLITVQFTCLCQCQQLKNDVGCWFIQDSQIWILRGFSVCTYRHK